VGQDRFRILELRAHKPYLSALVEDFPITNPDTKATHTAASQLRPWVSRYMTMLARAAETPFDAARLPNEPLALAYLAAIVLQTPPLTKQTLLALPSATELLREECKLYRSEIALLDTLLTQIPGDWDTSFSPN
jgi:Lon protease-like protein